MGARFTWGVKLAGSEAQQSLNQMSKYKERLKHSSAVKPVIYFVYGNAEIHLYYPAVPAWFVTGRPKMRSATIRYEYINNWTCRLMLSHSYKINRNMYKFIV